MVRKSKEILIKVQMPCVIAVGKKFRIHIIHKESESISNI